jgi:hypothetical protein
MANVVPHSPFGFCFPLFSFNFAHFVLKKGVNALEFA